MTFLIALLALAAVLAAAALHLARHDGRGPSAPPASRVDPMFRAPSDW